MRYPGDMGAGGVPDGQERPPGRPGLPRRAGADGQQRHQPVVGQPAGDGRPGHGGNADNRYSGHDGGGPGGEPPAGGVYAAGDEYAASGWPSGDDGGAAGGEHAAGGWYSDAGYSDGGYGYGDGGYGDEQGPAPGLWPADGGVTGGTTPGEAITDDGIGGWAASGAATSEGTASWTAPGTTSEGTASWTAPGTTSEGTASWTAPGDTITDGGITGWAAPGDTTTSGSRTGGGMTDGPTPGDTRMGGDRTSWPTGGGMTGGPAPGGASTGGTAADDRVLADRGATAPGSMQAASARYGAAGGTAGKGPVRGFPPAPGQAAPVYPPGQFSAWNQAAAQGRDRRGAGGTGRAAWPAALSAEHGYAEPDYAVLAVSDPAADATATQTWAVAEDRAAGSWQEMGHRAGAAPGAQPPAAGRARGGTAERERAMAPPAPSAARGRGDPRSPSAGAAGPPSTGQRPGLPAAGPAGGPERAVRQGSSRGRRARKPAGKGRPRILLAAGLAVVVAVGAGTYFYLSGQRLSGGAAAAPSITPAATQPAQPSPSPTPTGRWGHIQTRKIDPQKLTLHELFPVRFTSSGFTYSRTAVRPGKHCSSAVLGSRLQSAVAAADCTQVMRASYLSSGHKKMMGTIGVLNLRTAKAAQHAGKATGPSQFIAQLRGAKGPTRNLTKGTGIEEAEVKGHYLILIWAEFASLHAPKTKAQKKQLVQFCTRLIKKTANVSLSRRLVTGQP